jgi:hypothetical protein
MRKTRLHQIIPLIVALLIASAGGATATDESDADSYPDVVLLRNGSAIQGRILMQIPGQVIRIETVDRYERQISWDRVAMVTTMDRLRADRERLRENRELYDLVEKPVMHTNSLMLGIFAGDTVSAFAINLMNGISIRQRLQIGIGVGWDIVDQHTFTPFTLDVRYHWPIGQARVYGHLAAGYALGWYRKFDEPGFNEEVNDHARGSRYGGPALMLGFGLMTAATNLMSPRVEGVYRYQRSAAPEVGDMHYHLFGVMFGITLW